VRVKLGIEKGLVSTRKKPKHLFGKPELDRFHEALWTKDDLIFTHPRSVVQTLFLNDAFCWTGARIGAFFSKAGLQYQVNLVLRTFSGCLTD
jgi:hypothetical protein